VGINLFTFYVLGNSGYQRGRNFRNREYKVVLQFQSSFHKCYCLFKKKKKRYRKITRVFNSICIELEFDLAAFIHFPVIHPDLFLSSPSQPSPTRKQKAFLFSIHLALQGGKDVPLSKTLCRQNDTPFSRIPNKAF
jgi:hypothetical protein